MEIKTLVVDDEQKVREAIVGRLEHDPEFRVLGECWGGRQAVFAVERWRPDLVFLDVQMPDLDGFAVLEAIGPGQMPFPIFLTGEDRYAMRALEAHGLDFLVKPFAPEALEEALGRARARLPTETPDDSGGRLFALLHDLRSHPRYVERLTIRSRGRIVFVPTSEVDWIEADGNRVRVHAGDAEYLLRGTMRSLEERLDPREFARIHRSTIVRIDRIKELHPWPTGEYVVLLRSGKEMTLSRGYRESLRPFLDGEDFAPLGEFGARRPEEFRRAG